MLNKKEFVEIVSKGIWRHIFSKTYIKYKIIPDKIDFLNNLAVEINSFSYHASVPREYIVSNKHNLVSRIVPSLSLADLCVFYYCVKSIEENLSVQRVEGTFGGYQLGTSIRKIEQEEFDNNVSEIPFSFSPYSYNPMAWVKAWRDFQKKVYTGLNTGEYSYFIKFDIANFYDCINLNILENKIRSICDKKESFTIDLLFTFLKNWNRKFHSYSLKTVGLPQDEVGDCSRLLANFYLQDFDIKFRTYCKLYKIKYLRYSDDMILMGNNEKYCKEALFFASKELSKIGLNINSSKVDLFETKESFDKYWAFDIFNLLGDKFNYKNIEAAIRLYKEYNILNIKFRKSSVQSRILNCDLKKIDLSLRYEIINEVLKDDFLMNAEERQLNTIFNLLSSEDKIIFKEKLEKLIDVVQFNKYHYVLLKIADELNFDKQKLENKIISLSI